MPSSTFVLAQPDDILPPVGPRIASIIISVVLIAVLIWLYLKYRERNRAVARVAVAVTAFVAIFGIDGPALANRSVSGVQSAWNRILSGTTKVVSGGLDTVSGNRVPASALATIYFLLVIGVAALGIVFFWKTRSLPALVVMMLFALPAMAYIEFQSLSVWYVNDVGAPVYHGLAAIPHAVYEAFRAFVHAF